MKKKENDTLREEESRFLANSINKYPVILKAISIIFHKVLDGIDKGNRLHVRIDHNVLPQSSGNQVLSLDE